MYGSPVRCHRVAWQAQRVAEARDAAPDGRPPDGWRNAHTTRFSQFSQQAVCAADIPNPLTGARPMLDVLYILIGAAFLGGCVLYTIACDHL